MGLGVTYLPLGSMAVEAGLGSAVTPALPVVDVEVQLKVDHLSVELNKSVRVAVHETRKGKTGNAVGKGGGVTLGMGWEEEE